MSETAGYGGQAVIEGVMMRGTGAMAIACRRPNGGIAVRTQIIDGVTSGPLRAVPFIRGVLALADTLALGMRALTFASAVSREPDHEHADETPLPDAVLWGSIAVAVLFAAGLFFATPALLAAGLHMLGAGHLIVVAAEGAIRMALFLGYVAVIGLIPGIRRVFQYHGAEHMAVHAHEAGEPLTRESIRRFAKEHTRCGTSFLLVVMVLSIVTFIGFDTFTTMHPIARAATRILFVPLIASASYELLRLGARYGSNRIVRALFAPNRALQLLTTRVPDDDQIEIAIASLVACVELCESPSLVMARTQAEALPA